MSTSLRMRPGVAVLVAVLVVLAPLPTAAAATAAIDAADDVVTPAAGDLPSDVIRYGADGDPGFVVELENGTAGSLQDWANSSEGRELIDAPADNGSWALVAAGSPSVRGGLGSSQLDIPVVDLSIPIPTWYGEGLSGKSYVETVDVEQQVTIAQPVTLRSSATWKRPDFAARAAAAGDVSDSASFLAWSEDSERRSLREARTAIGDTAVGGTANGTGITVAPIDTGCNVLDEGLRGRVFGDGTAGSDLRIDPASKSFIRDQTVNASAGNYTAIEDGNGHGTWVASAIASARGNGYSGVAPDANLLCLQALDAEGGGSSHDIAAAIRYAADEDADVISLSLGSPVYSQEIADAIRDAQDQGAVVVVAAGNSRQTTRWVASPGDTPGPTITVAAGNTTDSAAAADRALPAFFSQMGPDNGQTDLSGGVTDGVGIDVTAPGMNLTAPVPTTDGLRRNRTLSGTSMATPLVAGAVAQELEANPDWRDDPDRVAGYVRNTTRVMPRATVAAAGHGYLAVDKLDATNTTGSQSAARTEAAESRDSVWKAQSDASGGVVSGLLDRLSGLGGLGG